MGEAIYWYSVCAVILFLKMLAISLYQGFHRIGKKVIKIPEDAKALAIPVASEDLPQVQRASRAWLNDLENIPIFLALGVAYIWTGASPQSAGWLFLLFTLSRVLHTVFYLHALQPWRAIAYAGGIVSMLIMSFNIVVALH